MKDAYDWGYLFIIINCGIGESTWSGPLSILLKWPLLIGTLLMFWKYATQYFARSPKDIWPYLITVALGIYNYYLLGSAWILYAILLTIFSRGRDPYHFVKMTFIAMTIIFIINMLVFIMRYNFSPKDLVIVATSTGKKYSMSFSSANEAARYWIYLVFLWYYLKRNIKPIYWIAIGFMSAVMLHYTNSDAIYFIFILFVMHLFRKISIFRQLICKYSRYTFLFFAAASFLLASIRHPLMFWLDSMFFTGRLSQITIALYTYGVSWFGNPIDTFALHSFEGETKTLYLDSGYGFLMIKTGIVYMALVSLIFIFSKTNRSYKLSCAIFLYALMTLAENNILHPTAIFPIVLAFSQSSFPVNPLKKSKLYPLKENQRVFNK